MNTTNLFVQFKQITNKGNYMNFPYLHRGVASWLLLLLFLVTPSFAATDIEYHYQGQVTINPEIGYLKADWKINFINSPEEVLTFTLRDTLSNIIIDGPNVISSSVAIQDKDNHLSQITIKLKPSSSPSEQYINISYDGVLLPVPMDNKINHIGRNYIELNVDSFWFPIDSHFNKLLTANFSINVGANWQAVSTGHVDYRGESVAIENTDPFLDIAVTLAPSFNVTKGNGFNLYDLREKTDRIHMLKEAITSCYSFLNQRFGAKQSLPDGHFILHDRPESGYARKAYIALSSITKSRPENLTGFVCHELTHYWSGFGKFDTVDNWLNESFAVYAELMAIREIYGEQTYNDKLAQFRDQIKDKELPSVWTKEDQSRRPYLVNYRKGPLLIADLEKRLGTDKFLLVIQRYMNEKVSTTLQLISIIDDVAGKQQSDWFKNQLSL